MAQALTKEAIVDLLKDENPQDADRFASYCLRLLVEKHTYGEKKGQLKNPWMATKTAAALAELFRRVKRDGLVFDGQHVTLGNTGISYDYIAYKNKMLKVYPDSKIDPGLVYSDDTFTAAKVDGRVSYNHVIGSPFGQTKDKLQGAYCVIINQRGEFITLLSKEDIEKHRKVAKTDKIWQEWWKEMVLKTVLKKACRQHFADVIETMDAEDNETNYDLENPLDMELEWKAEIDEITTVEALNAYYQKNRGRGKGHDQYIANKLKQLKTV